LAVELANTGISSNKSRAVDLRGEVLDLTVGS
jgi:hypothetical protein